MKLKTTIMFVKIGLIFLRPVKIGRWQTSPPSLPHCAALVHHFINIGQLNLELQSGNTEFGSKSAIFCPMRP